MWEVLECKEARQGRHNPRVAIGPQRQVPQGAVRDRAREDVGGSQVEMVGSAGQCPAPG